MCAVCDFYYLLSPATKANPAFEPDSTNRSVWGYYDSGDAAIMAHHYPNVGKTTIENIASCIAEPRLLEVLGVVEMVERYLEASFTHIRDCSLQIAANPLSVLFWSPKHKRVERAKTQETEMLHGPMEKLALRRASLDKINSLLTEEHGLSITTGCSCCVICLESDAVEALYASAYYQQRESFGRIFDADVLTSKGLWTLPSVSSIPDEILEKTADFGKPEVESYVRFAMVAHVVTTTNPVTVDTADLAEQARVFLTGLDQ